MIVNIYLSSTLADLDDCRKAVREVLRQDGHVVKDSYRASTEPTVAQCVADVRACDLYIGIVAWRYGFIPPGHDRSITELEFDAADASSRLLFLQDGTGWPDERRDHEPEAMRRVARLRDRISSGTENTSNLFRDSADLALKVSQAVRAEVVRRGWDRPTWQQTLGSLRDVARVALALGLRFLVATGAASFAFWIGLTTVLSNDKNRSDLGNTAMVCGVVFAVLVEVVLMVGRRLAQRRIPR